jgi:hypothetical protein
MKRCASVVDLGRAAEAVETIRESVARGDFDGARLKLLHLDLQRVLDSGQQPLV